MTAQSHPFVPEQIKELSEEVSRIAAALAKLSLIFAGSDFALGDAPEKAPEISVGTVAWLIKARAQRARYYRRSSVIRRGYSSRPSAGRTFRPACFGFKRLPRCRRPTEHCASVPEKDDRRRDDKFDAPLWMLVAVFVDLAPETSSALRQYIAEVVQSTSGRHDQRA
jgi:hypothetical protein